MSHTQRLQQQRHARAAAHSSSSAGAARLSRAHEAELRAALAALRDELRGWDRASRPARRTMLHKMLWMHEPQGAGIGATRCSGGNSYSGADGAATAAEEKEIVPAAAAAIPNHRSSTRSLMGGAAVAAAPGPTSLANASLESVYGAGASLLLMRVCSYLRLTYTLPAASHLNLQCLRLLRVFVEDAQGALRFVHEIVEAGGILTLLAIIELPLPGQSGAHTTAAEAAKAAGGEEALAAQQKLQRQQQQQLQNEMDASDDMMLLKPESSSHHLTTDEPPLPHTSRASLAASAALAKAVADAESEKTFALEILHRIAAQGRVFKECVCEARGGGGGGGGAGGGGVGIVIACLARSKDGAGTQAVSKQLLCALGMGNPRFASLVHEELLAVFRGASSIGCKRTVLQTLYFLLDKHAGGNHMGGAATASMVSLHPGSDGTDSAAASSVSGGFTADARYVDATVSLYHISDFQLHYDANLMLKLLIARHGLQDAAIQALMGVLKQKAVSSVSASTGGGSGSSRGKDREDPRTFDFDAASPGDIDPSTPQSPRSRLLGGGGRAAGRSLSSSSSSKFSDPKTCAVRVLNDLALGSYEFCLRLTQMGAINLLLDALCTLSNIELQHGSAAVLYTLHNNVQEAASLIKIMMMAPSAASTSSNAAHSTVASGDALYLSFLKSPSSFHRHLGSGDVARIQANLHNPHMASTFLSQRRLERRAQANAAAAAGTASKPGSRRGSAAQAAVAAAAAAMGLTPLSPHLRQGNALSSAAAAAASAASAAAAATAAAAASSGAHFALAEQLAAQSGGDSASASNAAATKPQLAPDHPSLRVGGGGTNLSSGSGAAASGAALTGSFLQAPEVAVDVDSEDAAFFALGMDSIARPDESGLTAAEHQKIKDKEKSAAADATRPAEALSTDKEAAQKSTSLASRSKPAHGASGAHGNKGSTATKDKAPFVPHPDAIRVPILSLHFDPALKLVDEGAPRGAGGGAVAAMGMGAAKGAEAKRRAGVHEGDAVAAQKAAAAAAATAARSKAPGEPSAPPPSSTSTELYTPFAPAAIAPPSSTPRGRTSATSAASAAAAASLVFAQRVCLPNASSASTARSAVGGAAAAIPAASSASSDGELLLKPDVVSDSFLRSVHFKDLSNPERSHFLTHGAAPAAAASASKRHGGADEDPPSLNPDGSVASSAPSSYLATLAQEAEDERVDWMHPSELIPHVEILDGHVGTLDSVAKAALEQSKLAALRSRRDEKRTKDAAVAAAAAERFGRETKFKNALALAQQEGEVYEGFTGATIATQKTADELSHAARKPGEPSLAAQAEEYKRQKAAAAAAAAKDSPSTSKGHSLNASPTIGLSPSQSHSNLFLGAGGARFRSSDSSLLSHVERTSNRSILAMAIQLDSTGGGGRTIDPRRWNAATRARAAAAAAGTGGDKDASAADAAPAVSSSKTPQQLATDSAAAMASALLADHGDDDGLHSAPSDPSARPPPLSLVLSALSEESAEQRRERLDIEAELSAIRAGGGGGHSSSGSNAHQQQQLLDPGSLRAAGNPARRSLRPPPKGLSSQALAEHVRSPPLSSVSSSSSEHQILSLDGGLSRADLRRSMAGAAEAQSQRRPHRRSATISLSPKVSSPLAASGSSSPRSHFNFDSGFQLQLQPPGTASSSSSKHSGGNGSREPTPGAGGRALNHREREEKERGGERNSREKQQHAHSTLSPTHGGVAASTRRTSLAPNAHASPRLTGASASHLSPTTAGGAAPRVRRSSMMAPHSSGHHLAHSSQPQPHHAHHASAASSSLSPQHGPTAHPQHNGGSSTARARPPIHPSSAAGGSPMLGSSSSSNKGALTSR